MVQSARRASAQVVFNGVDISTAISQYLLSLTYTDNEEDESDDLQIKLHDKDGIWLTSWLSGIIEADSDPYSSTTEAAATGSLYTVNAKSGLNIRTGPGTGHAKLGTLAYGTQVTVTGAEGAWSTIDYSGKTAYVSSTYLTPVENTAADSSISSSTSGITKGFMISAVLYRTGWITPGLGEELDCGQFELDAIDYSVSPNQVTIKGTSLPFTSQIRQTKKTKAWEKYTLQGIAAEMAANNGMSCIYESSENPTYNRVEQTDESDIAFLSRLSHDAGISLKATNNELVLFDQATYEKLPSVLTITRNDGTYEKCKLATGEAGTQYDSCRVFYADPNTRQVIEAVAKVADYDEKSKNNQQLEIRAKVASVGEAQALAAKRLRLHNKYAKTASFTLEGNPALVAGVCIDLADFGAWSGKYIIKQAKHTLSSSGYTTQLTLRSVLENY